MGKVDDRMSGNAVRMSGSAVVPPPVLLPGDDLMKLFRLAAFAAVVFLAACTSSPTDSATNATSPSFDGGNMIGSGNYTGEDPGTIGGGNDPQGTTSDTTSTSPGRGGASLGSGN
jgi:hypothetical protein